MTDPGKDYCPLCASEVPSHHNLTENYEALQSTTAVLLEALKGIVDMIDNCAGVPREPDSLPMMVMQHARAAITAAEEKS